MPQGVARAGTGGAPLSQWSAVRRVQARIVSPGATFDWNGVDDVLTELTMRHGMQPQVGNVRIWRNFSINRDGALPGAAITGPDIAALHDFAPLDITRLGPFQRGEIAPLILWPDVSDTLHGPVPDWRMAQLRRKITDRVNTLNHWARFVPDEGTSALDPSLSSLAGNILLSGAGCAYFQFVLLSAFEARCKQAPPSGRRRGRHVRRDHRPWRDDDRVRARFGGRIMALDPGRGMTRR